MVGEASVRRLCFTEAPPCRCHRRSARRRSSQLPSATPEYVRDRVERVGANRVAGDLTVGEFAPVSAVAVTVNPEVGDDRWGPAVSESKRENSAILYFLVLNSAVIFQFCRNLFTHPKILKNFV